MTRVSIALPPSHDFVAYAVRAEQLGYDRVWAFDSPALYTDIWVSLARAADATTRLGLATGVSVPSLRHPMVTASAIAAIEDIAPGRLVVAFGTGYTARKAMGQKPMRWSDLEVYTRQVRALLDGEVVDVDGQPCEMLQPHGFGPARPIATPLWVAPNGPKGFAVARALGVDGILVTKVPAEHEPTWAHAAMIVAGTVLRPGEDHTSERVVEAMGPFFSTSYHGVWEYQPDALDRMPGGSVWRDLMLSTRPERERHLAVHEGHLAVMTARDRAAVSAAGPAILASGWTGDDESFRAREREAVARGVDEIVYMPAGPDIPAELEAFIGALRA